MTSVYQVALITGAASGIGRALALALAAEGVAIAAVDLAEDRLRALQAEVEQKGGRFAWAVADVTDAEALKARTAELEQRLGPVDLLIASAGIGVETSAGDYNAAEVARVINVNLIGVSNSIGAVLPGMLARGRGHLVALSSVASARGFPRLFGYSASKAGVNAIMDGLRVELRSRSIAVTTIRPGWIRTPMTANIKEPMDGIMDVDEAARHILYAIRRRLRVYTFPRSMVWQMRMLTWLPLGWQDRHLEKLFLRGRLS